MAVRRYRFASYHPVRRHQLHTGLPVSSARWNEQVGGSGSMDGTIVVPEDPQLVAILKQATEPLQAAVYIRNEDNNNWLWGGPVVDRDWDPRTNQITISVMEWRAWLYQLLLPPDPNNDLLYQFGNVDQLEIARTIALLATAGGLTTSSHPITATVASSGRLRDLNFYGSQMQYAGALIDSMANRDDGFDWTLVPTIGPDGLPLMNFHPSYPERGSVLPNLIFKATPKGGNCIPGQITQSASTRYGRFWATGTGQPPDQVYAYDNDPDLANGNTLRFDGAASFSTVSERPTLASHARRSRRFYAPGINLVTVAHNFRDIDPESYGVGDRGRLLLRDRWMDVEQENVRVISREISTSGAGSVRVTLDLTDDTLPEVDTGGSV